MKIGLIVAIETGAIFDYYHDVETLEGAPRGFSLYRVGNGKNEIYILHAGMGEVAAASGVQYLITAHGVDRIVNFGVVGGLTDEMKKLRVCVVERVVHYKYDCSEFMDLVKGQVAEHDSIFLPTDADMVEKALAACPELLKATCCSGDKFVGTEKEKAQLHADFEGDVCDMESAGIVLTCEANGVPCLLLKAVSDGLAGGAKEFYEELKDAAFECLGVADTVMKTL